jgi:arylsulfatase
MAGDDNRKKSNLPHNALNRRNMLLGGTTLAAVSAITSGGSVQMAQAQQQTAAPAGAKPNILVIFGDEYWSH